MKLIIFITVCLLLGASYAQFDHTWRTAAGLSLTAVSGNPSNGISTFTASAADEVVGDNCRCNSHTVTNVRPANGPENSGSYFRVSLSHAANASLSVFLQDPVIDFLYDIVDTNFGTFFSVVGFCDPSPNTCTFDYYCENYPSASTLEIVVCSDFPDSTLQNSINFYTIGITQYVANVQIIGASRTEAQTTGVVNTYAATNPGPSNFVHYYHDLQPSLAEAGASSRLFIEATNWAGATGSAYICVSFGSLVATTNSLSSVVFPGGDINGPVIIPNQEIDDPDFCPIYCQQGTVTGASSIVVASFNSCDFASCGFPEQLWIGVRPPSATVSSTYTVNIRFRSFSVPQLIDVASFPSEYDADITDTCDGDLGNFSCEDYYEVTSRPTVQAGQPGPYLAVNVYGVYRGSVAAYLSDGHLAGFESLCPFCDIFDTCDEVSTTADVPDCWMVVQPCDWDTGRDWVVTIEGLLQDSTVNAIEYGLAVHAGTWPVTSVTATEWETGEPFIDSVKPYHYHHYVVTFEDADLFDDSYFEVQFYTFHEEDEVGFAWKYGGFADDGTCYGYDGLCTTASNCDTVTEVGNNDYCRFLFLPCPYTVGYPQVDHPEDNIYDGFKVSQLQAGSYYFAVWGVGDSSRYYTSVSYTALFNLRRSLPVFDTVTVSGRVFEFEYTQQYYFTVPDDDTLSGIIFVLSEVNNGDLTLYARCGALAGSCPCWTFDDSCSTELECAVFAPVCGCPAGERIYLSVFNSGIFIGSGEGEGNSFSHFLSGSFTLTPYIQYYFPVETTPIQVARAATVIDGTLSNYYDGANPGSAFDADFYHVSVTNIDPKHDALVLTLTVLVEAYEVQSGVVKLTVAKGGVAYTDSNCYPQRECEVSVNSWVTDGQLATCELVFQPCYRELNCVSADCDIQSTNSLAWDYTDNFYVTVSLAGDHELVFYSLTTQVIDQSPLPVSNNEPVYGYAGINQYVHYSFALPASRSANAILYVNLYKDFDQAGSVALYVHHDSSANPTLAGESSDCYASDFCSVCSLAYGFDKSYCVYEYNACQLDGLTGTVYVSVYGFGGFIGQLEGLAKPEYTLTVAVWEPVALLVDNVGLHHPDRIWDSQELYYSVTVPTLVTGSIVGRVLTIDVGGVRDGTIFFTIKQIEPHNDCGCSTGPALGTVEISQWRRYPCELNTGDVYYVSVNAAQDRECDPVSFLVHARIYDVTEETITLTAVDSTVVGSYDTTTYTIGYLQWKAIKFTTNAVEGTVLNIDITQPLPIGGVSKSIEARLSIGEIATRSGYNSDIGLANVGEDPDDSSCVALLGACSGELRTTCHIYVDACTVPQGATTWYLTFTGEDLSVDQVSDPISISIRVVAPRNIVTFPAINDYTTTSTSVTFSTVANSISSSYGRSFVTTSSNSNGINAGDILSISYSGSAAVNFYVQYATETGTTIGCPDICALSGTNPTCTFTACENIASATWYIVVQSSTDQSGTVSVRRTQSPTTTLAVSTINTVNTVFNFDALGPNQWRYHAINVPASISSHYEVVVSGGASFNNVVYTGVTSSSAVYWPFLAISPLSTAGAFTIFTGGETSIECGGLPIGGIEATCCYPTDTSVFAVAAGNGGLGAYSIEVQFIEFSDGNPISVNLPSVTARTTTGGKVAWFSFSLPAGNHFWFELDVTSGAADLYLNKGSRAGSDATLLDFQDDFGNCWYNDGLIQQVCQGAVIAPDFCDGFIAADCYPCEANNENSVFYFAVIPTNGGDATYTLTVISQVNHATLNTGANNNLLFPSTGTQNIRIIDDTLDSQDFAVYSHFVWNFNKSPYDISQFIPIVDDPEVLDEFTYPHITFTISNVVQVGTSTSADASVDFFINLNFLAGISDCYGGRDITNGGSLLPCLENSNGAAFVDPATGDITCSVLFCDLYCGDDIYLSVGRATIDIVAVSFSIGVGENYAQVSDEIDIIPIALTTSGFTNTYTNAQSLNEVVYYRFTAPSLNNYLDSITNYFEFDINNVVGDSTLDIRVYTGSFCQNFNDAVPLCSTITTLETCRVVYDPCGASQFFIDPNPATDFFLRVSRTAGSAATWGFTLVGKIFTATAIDASEATLVLGASGAHYSAEKEIFDGTWQFYEFNVDNGDFGGYNSLSLFVSNLGCDNINGDLEVYVSWLEDTTGVIDVARPNRWPTQACYVESDVVDAFFFIDNWCNTWGGVYRVALFADFDLQVYDQPVLGVVYPATYSIEFDIFVNEIPEELPLNCANQVFGLNHYTIRPDASNRGSRLIFDFESNDFDDATLWVSKNANPYETSNNCAWGGPDSLLSEPYSDITGDYYCNTGGVSCRISIDICEYSDDTWFIFIDGDFFGDYTLTVYNNRVYTPVVELATTGFSYSSGGFASYQDYQFYNFIVDDSRDDFFFQFTIYQVGCDGCALTAFLLEGPHGYAAGTGLDGFPRSQACDQCDYANCRCSDSSCDTSALGYCVLYGSCTINSNQLFIGVRAFGIGDPACPYAIDVSSIAPSVSIVEDIEICTSVTCTDFYKLVTSSGVADFTGKSVTLEIINYDSSEPVGINFASDRVATPVCFDDFQVCDAGETCVYVLDCNDGSIYITMETLQCQRGAGACSGVQYSIRYSVEDFDIGTATIGTPVTSSGIVTITSSTAFYADTEVLTTGPGGCNSFCQVSYPAGFYYVIAPGATFNNFQITSLSSTFTTATFDEDGLLFFSITVPAGVDGFTLEFQDFTYPAGDWNYQYFVQENSPYIACEVCSSGEFSLLDSSACFSDGVSVVYSCAEQTTYYLTLANCDDFVCDQSFRVRVIFNQARTLIGTTHTGAYTTLISPSTCSPQTTWRYYTIADGPLYVTLREVGGTFTTADVSLYTPASGCFPDGCSVFSDVTGDQSSCGVQDGCSKFSCTSGLYYIDVSLGVLPFTASAVELLVVNSWVDLSSSVSDTIIGSEKHFYRVNVANAAQTFKLTVHSGPALRFLVFDGCSNFEPFSETQICAFGDCYIFVPTLAKHSKATNYYIELLSDFTSSENAEWHRNNNDRAQAPTDYTLSVVSGGSNCGAAPSTGFCADASIAGVDVFADISINSVWSFINPDLKDQEAECLYHELTDRCVYPTDECRYWLKIFACLETFPQCDGSGFQLAPCVAVCNKVEEACGPFSDVSTEFPFECCRDRYITDNSTSTCYNIPPPPPPPPTFDDNDASGESSFPPPIEVPVFPTIFATMPPASNFFTFSVGKDAEIERQLVNSASSLSSIVVLLVLIVAMLI